MADLPFAAIDHVQLAMPPGEEETARRFYHDLLGMTELVKPPELAKRGGCWFESGNVQIHLGVEKNFRPAKKAHPALRCRDYVELTTKLNQAGIQTMPDTSVPGVDRCYIQDPFGNRIELIATWNSIESKSMLVLASASPRRQELLHNAGIAFTVQAANVIETPMPDEAPEACAQRLAREKALAISLLRSNDLILGADTIVVVDNLILGKPRDRNDAIRMLQLLSGRKHRVITGICLVCPQKPSPGFIETRFETTAVEMMKMTDAEIEDYVATGEPMDKAGAYAIQGVASRWVSRIEGDYFNVVGLPVSLVYQLLRKHKLL